MTAPASRLVQLERALVGAETRLALLDSLTPINFATEVARLTASFDQGRFELPEFRFLPESLRRGRSEAASATLVAAQLALADPGFQQELSADLLVLLGERIFELQTEVQMLRACGSVALRALAVTRYPFTSSEIEAALRVAHTWAEALDDVPSEQGDLVLATSFEAKRRQMGSFSHRVIIVERNLASLCAVGGMHLYVQRGVRVSSAEADRLWVHEVEGHLLPRLRATEEPPPFSIGSPGSSVDEEGRAVFLEEKHGLLHARRRRELAVRFLLALALREQGDDGVRERLRLERERGARSASLAQAVCRIYRGGGLAREVIYLPGYNRVKATLDRSPALDQFFRRGLVSIASLPFFVKHFPQEARNQ